MASLLIDDREVTVSMSAAEKIEALHGNVTVPRAAVVRARVVPDGLEEVHGLKMPGTALPGIVMVGTWQNGEMITFAVCHGHRSAVVLDLADQVYDRIVVTVENPDDAVTRLKSR
jgi:predicted dinucleotide-binding enzyme